MFDPPKGPWEIVPIWLSSAEDLLVDQLDRSGVEEFLRQFKFDFGVMRTLRELLTPTDPVSRFTDDEVIETVAWRLATRELALRDTLRRVSGAGGGGGGGGDGKGSKKDDLDPSAGKKKAGGLAVKPPAPVKGAIRVLVVDDTGKPVANIPITGPGSKKTDASGTALFEGLDEGTYWVKVTTPLPDPVRKDFYLPIAHTTQQAHVTAGGVADVKFQLDPRPWPTIVVDAPKILLVKQDYQGKDKPGVKPHRIPVKLGLQKNYDGVGELTVSPGDVRVFENQADKTEKSLPWKIKAADLKAGKTVWFEGKQPSSKVQATIPKLTLKDGTIPPKIADASEKITCVLLQLDIHKVRPESGADPPVIARAARIDPGRFMVVQDPAKHLFGQRAMLVLSKAKPVDYTGKLDVKPLNASVEAYDKEVPAAGQAPLTGNSLKFANATIDAAKGQTLWVQGKTQSGALADTGWTVETEDVPGQEGDRVAATVLTISLEKIETTDITNAAAWESDDDFCPRLHEKAKLHVKIQPMLTAFTGKLRIDFGRLNNQPKGADPLKNGSFTLVSRVEHPVPASKPSIEFLWDGKSTVAAAQEFSNRTTPNVNGGAAPNLPLPAIASGQPIPHGLYFIDQICLLQDSGIVGRLRPDNIDLSVPILANLTFNGHWAADLRAFGLSPFQADLEKALVRFGGRDYMIRDPSLANRINVRFISSPSINNSQSVLSSIGGPDPAGGGLFGSTPDGPAPLSDNLYTFFEGLGKNITIFPSTFLRFNNSANVADQSTFRGIFAPLGVTPAQTVAAPGHATARAVDAAGAVTGACTAADDKANLTVALDVDGMATVTSTNPAKVPAARATAIQAALRAFVRSVGNTINHETAHGLGVVSRVRANNKITIAGTTVTSPLNGDAGAHNQVTSNTNIVDAGNTRRFVRRIEAAGNPQQKFSATNTQYLRDCIPFDQTDN